MNNPLASLNAAASADYVNTMNSQASAIASLGTLHAFAQTSIPPGDGLAHNLQSHAVADSANTLGASGYDYASAAPVPEPASAWTLGLGLGFLAWRRRRF